MRASKDKTRQRARREAVAFWIFRAFAYLVVLFAAAVLIDILIKGAPRINWAFLTQGPDPDDISKGGVFPAIAGTFYLVAGSIAIALPIGVFTAIYLSEYARDTRFTRLVRICITNLAGLPSIVFGLFGYALFVMMFGLDKSLIAGCLTLMLMILPVIITASEEALRAVPQGFREGSLALGATKWQSVRTNVLPYAMSGVFTGSILGVARVAGETAPIMFTAVAFTAGLPSSVFKPVEALTFYLYMVVTTTVQDYEKALPTAYGAALVLIVMVFGMNLLAMILRAKLRKKYRW
jgi:phosphate transport system permease protein